MGAGSALLPPVNLSQGIRDLTYSILKADVNNLVVKFEELLVACFCSASNSDEHEERLAEGRSRGSESPPENTSRHQEHPDVPRYERHFHHLSIVKREVPQFMDFSFVLFFSSFSWLAYNLGTQKLNQPQKTPVLRLHVNFSRLREAAVSLTKGGRSFRAAMAAEVNTSLNTSCTRRRKSVRRLCQMLLPKICLN